MRANQLRLWLSAVAYTLMQVLRQQGLKETSLSTARCDTIRLKVLKIGVLVQVTVRRVWLSFAQSYPYQTVFAQALANLRQWRPVAPRPAPA